MKVIHTSWEAERYGIRTFLLNPIPYQNKSLPDLKAEIIFQKTNKEGEKQYAQKGIKYYSLGVQSAKDLRNIKLIYNFYKIFRKYDLINFHYATIPPAIAAKLACKKIIYTFHGTLGLRNKWYDIVTKFFHHFFLTKYCDYFTFASQASYERYIKVLRGLS
ncbi:MAG: glycosyltransferase [candidate division WOR-3 bacterium]